MTRKIQARKSPKPRQKRNAGGIERKGRAVLRELAPALAKQGVPADRFVKVNVETGEFVTGKSPEETERRFELMYPDAVGWCQRFGELAAESDNARTEH